jgi:hypothetical protein
MSAKVALIINSQLSDSEKAELKNAGATEDLNISDIPVIKIFNELFCQEIGEPFDTLLAAANSYSDQAQFTDYAVLDSTPYPIRMLHGNQDLTMSVGKIDYTSTVPKYITDIMALSDRLVAENGSECKLEGVYCFDASAIHQGIAVYLKTDKGVYVNYYEDLTSEAQYFTEEEFRIQAGAYYNYLKSDENNYNENGEALGGNKESFASFTQSDRASLSKEAKNRVPIVILLISGISLAIGVLVSRHRRAKKFS